MLQCPTDAVSAGWAFKSRHTIFCPLLHRHEAFQSGNAGPPVLGNHMSWIIFPPIPSSYNSSSSETRPPRDWHFSFTWYLKFHLYELRALVDFLFLTPLLSLFPRQELASPQQCFPMRHALLSCEGNSCRCTVSLLLSSWKHQLQCVCVSKVAEFPSVFLSLIPVCFR